jgi:ribonuclease P protein component
VDFPRSARVRKRREYLNFFHQSDVKRLDSCIIFRIPNQKNQARLGITVKARTSSVYRNDIKRQIREVFRHAREHLQNFDYNIVIPSQVRITHVTASKVRKNLESIWSHENTF